jgi:DNA polymerase III subunit beta
LIVNRQKFLNSFLIAAAVTSPRSPKEVLQMVKIEANEDGVRLLATDMDAGIRIDLEGVDIQTPGKALLNVARVGGILREISDETIHLESSDTELLIKSHQSKFQLPNVDPNTFPSVAPFSETAYFEVAAPLFRELVRRTVFATDTESTRYALGGVNIETTSDSIVAVATDGRRLAKMEGSGTCVGGYTGSGSNTIVPIKTLSLMEKSLTDGDVVVQLVARTNDILLKAGNTMIFSRLVEGRYPNWRQVIPQRDNNHRVSSIVGPFYSCVRQASVVADVESRGVEFLFEPGNVKMQTATANVGESLVELPIEYEGPNIEMTLNGQFISDFFRVLNPEQRFSIDIASNTESALFSLDDGYVNVIMPMARDR